MPAAVFGATGIGPEKLLSAAGQREKKPLPFVPSCHSARLMREGERKKAGPSQDGQGEAVLLEETKKGRCGVLFSYLLQGKEKKISSEFPCPPGRSCAAAGGTVILLRHPQDATKAHLCQYSQGCAEKAGRVRATSCGR